MKKTTRLAEASTPDGKPVALYERDGVYSLRIAGVELMTTRQHASEERLAELTCSAYRSRSGARILIGGLGFGFTLRAALAALGSDARVVVAELLPCVVQWNLHSAYPFAHRELADPRVALREADVARVLAEEPGGFDVVLLDVDNGPAALSQDDNAALYTGRGLALAQAALRPGGCLGVWSVEPAPAFEARLRQAGLAVQVEKARAHRTSGGFNTLYLARRPQPAS